MPACGHPRRQCRGASMHVPGPTDGTRVHHASIHTDLHSPEGKKKSCIHKHSVSCPVAVCSVPSDGTAMHTYPTPGVARRYLGASSLSVLPLHSSSKYQARLPWLVIHKPRRSPFPCRSGRSITRPWIEDTPSAGLGLVIRSSALLVKAQPGWHPWLVCYGSPQPLL